MILRFPRKKTPFPVSDLAPSGLFDLHTHVLPGVDDGARDWTEAGAMLDGMAELGYVKVAATPHFDNRALQPSTEAQQQMIAQINQRRERPSPEVLASAEIIFDELFVLQEDLGGFPHLGAERTYLVEFGPYLGSVPSGIEAVAFKLIVRGVTLILAHPERYPDLAGRPEQLEALRRAGVLLQLDILSLAGRYGPGARHQALSLLEAGAVDFVSSDLHSPYELPYLRRALEELARFDEDEFRRLASDNPRLALEGRAAEVRRNG